MKFEIMLNLNFDSTHNLVREEIEAQDNTEATARAHKLCEEWGGEAARYSIAWVKSAARASFEHAQKTAAPARPERRVIRGSKDVLHGETITLRFGRGVTHTMSTLGWLALVEKCKEMNAARSIVNQVARGIIPNHLPA